MFTSLKNWLTSKFNKVANLVECKAVQLVGKSIDLWNNDTFQEALTVMALVLVALFWLGNWQVVIIYATLIPVSTLFFHFVVTGSIRLESAFNRKFNR